MEAEQIVDGTTGELHSGPSELVPLGAEDGSIAPLDELDFDDGVLLCYHCFHTF